MQIFSSDIDAFLAVDGEVFCIVFQNLLLRGARKNSYFENFEEKGATEMLLFSKVASTLSKTCNFTLNKVFTILILSFSLITLTGFTVPTLYFIDGSQ